MASSKARHFDKNLFEQSLYFKALAHPARIAIIYYLHDHGITSFNTLCLHIPLAKVTVSQHLRDLKKLNLIILTEVYPHSFYQLNMMIYDELIAKIVALHTRLISINEASMMDE